jgi:hypothetical protein
MSAQSTTGLPSLDSSLALQKELVKTVKKNKSSYMGRAVSVLLLSPANLVLRTAEATLGTTVALVAAVPAIVSEDARKVAFKGLVHAGTGAALAVNSMGHMASLGYIGYAGEEHLNLSDEESSDKEDWSDWVELEPSDDGVQPDGEDLPVS